VEPGEFRPILTALALPPAAPLLLALLGLAVACTRRKGVGLAIAFIGIASAAVLSTHGAGLWLARTILPQVAVAAPEQLRDVQAIVVLGGGVRPEAPEFGAPQASESTLGRVRYGAWLARRSAKPVAFAGGVGWAAAGTDTVSEGTVARRLLQQDYGITPRWVDDQSRDTGENARRMAEVMRKDGVRRIALVTDSWHLPRATLHFQQAGFEVVPAPTNIPAWRERPVLEWMPSAHGVWLSRAILREWLALQLARR
jgi:uncharacterized SAM-binding protein YcdF (DUF218 family)